MISETRPKFPLWGFGSERLGVTVKWHFPKWEAPLYRISRFTGFGPIVSLISGTLSVMTGVVLLVYPNAGKLVLSLLFPLWFIAHCISRLANLNMTRFVAGNFAYTFTLVMNIIGLVLGTLMLFDPLASLGTLRYIVSFYLILLGIDCIVLAFSKIGSRF